MKPSVKPVKPIRAWADVGSHGGIFVFGGGPVYERYGPLLHIWEKKMADYMVPVLITPIRPKSRRRKAKND